MKFRLKPFEIEAEPYRRGMEDGWIVASGCGGERFHATFEAAWADCPEVFRDSHILPVLKVGDDHEPIHKGDWIGVHADGTRFITDEATIRARYDEVRP